MRSAAPAVPPPLQVALLSGRGDPSSCALAPGQMRFLDALAAPDVAVVRTAFPWPHADGYAGAHGADGAAPLAFRPVPLPLASVRNAVQYLGSRRASWAVRHRPALDALLARAGRTVLVCGGCGLELPARSCV